MSGGGSEEAGPALSLRPATAADLASLRALATQVFLDTYATDGIRAAVAREVEQAFSFAALQAELERADSRILLAEHAEHLVAFAQLGVGVGHALVGDATATELARLYVQAPFQRRGVGRRLLAAAEALARAEGSATLWLTAWVGNARALAFYRSQGYRELGSTIHTFEDEGFENRLFAKPLVGPDISRGAP